MRNGPAGFMAVPSSEQPAGAPSMWMELRCGQKQVLFRSRAMPAHLLHSPRESLDLYPFEPGWKQLS